MVRPAHGEVGRTAPTVPRRVKHGGGRGVGSRGSRRAAGVLILIAATMPGASAGAAATRGGAAGTATRAGAATSAGAAATRGGAVALAGSLRTAALTGHPAS